MCFSGIYWIHIVFSIIGSIILFIFNYLICKLIVYFRMNSKQLLSKLNGNNEMNLALFKTIMIISNLIIKSDSNYLLLVIIYLGLSWYLFLKVRILI